MENRHTTPVTKKILLEVTDMSNNYEQNNQNKYSNSYDEARTVRTPRISRTARIRTRIRATTRIGQQKKNKLLSFVHNCQGLRRNAPIYIIFRMHI